MVTLKDVRVGSIVMLRGNFGTAPAIRAVIDNVEDNIKNGVPGVDYHPASQPASGSCSWAYLDQVDSVVQY
jgi:hypothetical protein